MRAAIIATALLLMLLLSAPASGESLDDNPEVISLYAKGKRLLRQADWLGAARIFEELAGRFPQSKNLDLFLFNRAKAEYRFGEFNKALAGFNGFTSRYPDSPFRAHAGFFAGNIYYSRGNLSRALRNYIEAYSYSSDSRLTALLLASIEGLLVNASSVALGPADFEAVGADKRCPLMKLAADVLLEREEYYVARDILEQCGETLDIDSLPGATRIGRELELAIVLPFSGELQEFGDEIYDGAVIAADFYRQETGKEIKLVPYDTKGDPVSAARIVKELSNSTSDAVIGPLTSEEAAVVSAVLSCEVLPLILPAATQVGLTRLSGSSFQLSPNIELQAVQMAEYAIVNLQADSVAIITSTSPDHLLMSRAFAQRFGELGGTVIAIEYYRSRDKDFGAYINDLKTALLETRQDSTFFIDARGDTLDVNSIPANIDCLYLPGTPEQLRLLLPQIRYYNLQAAYLGSDGWGDDEIYRLGDEITRAGVFPSPFIRWTTGEEYTSFSTAYDARFGQSPQRLAALGYDAVRIISGAVLDGGVTRQALVDRLGRVRDFSGAAGRVTFGEHRENVEMPIYRIEAGIPVAIGISRSAAELED